MAVALMDEADSAMSSVWRSAFDTITIRTNQSLDCGFTLDRPFRHYRRG
jgi:hypothetical protein